MDPTELFPRFRRGSMARVSYGLPDDAHWSARGDWLHNFDPAPFAPASVKIEPQDETDTFCTCPRCGLAGHHVVAVGSFHPPTVPGQDGEQVVVVRMSAPPAGTRVATRTCVFCAHEWRRIV